MDHKTKIKDNRLNHIQNNLTEHIIFFKEKCSTHPETVVINQKLESIIKDIGIIRTVEVSDNIVNNDII